MKIGFIGLGNMGGSLARLVAQDDRFRSELLLANRSFDGCWSELGAIRKIDT